MSNMNKEIEELKKKLEELEKASLNAVKNVSEQEKENIIPKEEREKIINEGVDFDGEIRRDNLDEETPEEDETPEEEEPKKKKGSGLGILTVIVLLIFGTIIGLAIRENLSKGTTKTGLVQKDYSYESDEERGFGIANGIRGWFDEEKYKQNQPNKDKCFRYTIYGVKVFFCDATEEEVRKARENGTEDTIDIPVERILKMYQIDSDHAEPDGSVPNSKLMTMSDEERGYTIFNGARIWNDLDKYEKYQTEKEKRCVPFIWDNIRGITCYSTKDEVEYAERNGTATSGLIDLERFYQKFGKTIENNKVNTVISPEMRNERKKILSNLLKEHGGV